MMILLLLLAALAVLSAAGLWSTITHDGLGIRPAPRSHRADAFGTANDS